MTEETAPGEHDRCLHSLRHHCGKLVQVNIKKGSDPKKTNGLFSELCQLFPQPKSGFQSCTSAWNHSETIIFRV